MNAQNTTGIIPIISLLSILIFPQQTASQFVECKRLSQLDTKDFVESVQLSEGNGFTFYGEDGFGYMKVFQLRKDLFRITIRVRRVSVNEYTEKMNQKKRNEVKMLLVNGLDVDIASKLSELESLKNVGFDNTFEVTEYENKIVKADHYINAFVLELGYLRVIMADYLEASSQRNWTIAPDFRF